MRSRLHVLTVISVVSTALVMPIACGGGGGETPPPNTTTTVTKTTVDPTPTATTTASSTAETPPAPKMTMAEMQKKNVLGNMAAFNAHDAKKLASYYSADAAVRAPGMAQEAWREMKGREGIEKAHEGLFKGVPDVKTAASRVLLSGDVAIVEWTSSGTDTVGMGGAKPTGKAVGFKAVSIQWFDKDGLIKQEHAYYDAGTIAGQLGMLPKGMKVRPVAAMPSGEPMWLESKGDDAEKKNIEAVKAFYGTFAKGDEKGFLGMLDEKASHSDYAMPEDVTGKDAAKKEFQMGHKAFPDMAFAVEGGWAAGDTVVLESTMSGTNKGAMPPFIPKATNKAVTTHGAEVLQLKDGKLLHGDTYANSVEMVSQLGLMPPKGDAPKDAGKDAGKKPDATPPKK